MPETDFNKLLLSGKTRKRSSRFRTINFQLQAMVVIVTIGSLLLLGILFQITQDISIKTSILSKSAELNSLVKEWETELSIGTRSKIKFISLKKPIFNTNYLNSIKRIDGLYEQIRRFESDFGKGVMDSLESFWRHHKEYRSLAGALKSKLAHRNELKKHEELLKEKEGIIKNGLQFFQHEVMVSVRKENLKSMETTMSSSKKLVLIAMGCFVVINVFIWLLMKVKILAPLKKLEDGAMRIGEGDLGHQVSVNTRNEIGDLVDVLNKMSIQLKRNQDAEVKLQRLETIGQVVTSVNHEINNPLMIISGNAEYLSKMLGEGNEKIGKKLSVIMAECRRIFEVTQKLKTIKDPVVERYVGEETTMIDLKRSN
ncbi:HAMP domain-containing protein [Fibrobacterota bacterium]